MHGHGGYPNDIALIRIGDESQSSDRVQANIRPAVIAHPNGTYPEGHVKLIQGWGFTTAAEGGRLNRS